MPIKLPNLDNRTYADLVEEGLKLIPAYAEDWTNHNPSDPGITLVELFAYLSEMLIYRLNRITDDNIRSFLKLLNGPDWQDSGSTRQALDEDVRETMRNLRKRQRAVTCQDFEILALQADLRVGRAQCIPRRNLLMDHDADRLGSVSVIIVPREENQADLPELSKTVQGYFEPRRMLTTNVHVVGPVYLTVRIQVTVVPLPDEPLPAEADAVIEDRLVEAMRNFYHPLKGGHDGAGWPFGRDVFLSEIYLLIDQVPGVDYVDTVGLETDDDARLRRNAEGDLISIAVNPFELVDAQITSVDVKEPVP